MIAGLAMKMESVLKTGVNVAESTQLYEEAPLATSKTESPSQIIVSETIMLQGIMTNESVIVRQNTVSVIMTVWLPEDNNVIVSVLPSLHK